MTKRRRGSRFAEGRGAREAGRVLPAVAALAALTAAAGMLATSSVAEGNARRKRAQVELGRRLFMDETVSGAGKFSCASCHDPEYGFTDRARLSRDENGETLRHSQTLLALGGDGFHWDGEFPEIEDLLYARLGTTLEQRNNRRRTVSAHFQASQAAEMKVDQATFRRRIQSLAPVYYGPVTPVTPGGAPTPVAIVNRLDDDGRYAALLTDAFGDDAVTTPRLVDSMAAYMATIQPTKSPWDRWLKGERSALSESQQRGLALFEGKAGCADCHPTKGEMAATLTDGRFHNTGVAYRVSYDDDILPGPGFTRTAADTGFANQTFAQEHTGRFKTPTLRDVALRAPYMHDGSFRSLRDVVDYYAAGGTPSAHLDDEIAPADLTAQDRDDIVEFLHALTGEERPGLGRLTSLRKSRTRIRVVGLDGKPLAGAEVRVVPAGDRLIMPSGKEVAAEPQTVVANDRGWLTFTFPPTTHVRLRAEDVEIGLSRMLPDSVGSLELVAVPRDVVAVRVRFAARMKNFPDRVLVSPRAGTRTTDARFELPLVRTTSKDSALYAAPRKGVIEALGSLDWDRSAPLLGAVRLAWNERGEGRDATQSAGNREFDLAGGQSDTIDLRPDPQPTSRGPAAVVRRGGPAARPSRPAPTGPTPPRTGPGRGLPTSGGPPVGGTPALGGGSAGGRLPGGR